MNNDIVEALKKKGFELFGDLFKDTLTYQIIQRKKKEASLASDSERIIIPLDELTKICGLFSTDSIVNNYYNCKHPDCRDGDDDEDSGKWVGACTSFNCPLANDYESEDYKNVDGDHRMVIHDLETISKLSDSLRSPGQDRGTAPDPERSGEANPDSSFKHIERQEP